MSLRRRSAARRGRQWRCLTRPQNRVSVRCEAALGARSSVELGMAAEVVWERSAGRKRWLRRASLVTAAVLASVTMCVHVATAAPKTSTPGTAILTVRPPTVEDNFQRANATAGWGTTTNTDGIANLPWQDSLSGSTPYGFLSNQHGVIVYAGVTGHKVAGYVNTPRVMGGDTLAKFRFTATDAALAGVIVQRSDSSNWYQADIATTTQYGFTKNTLELTIRREGIMIHAADVPFVVGANTDYWIRENIQVAGGVAEISARAWADGTPEPKTWMVTYDDTTPLPAGNGGAIGDWIRDPQPGEQIQFGTWSYTA